jgi:hypothetical protein
MNYGGRGGQWTCELNLIKTYKDKLVKYFPNAVKADFGEPDKEQEKSVDAQGDTDTDTTKDKDVLPPPPPPKTGP